MNWNRAKGKNVSSATIRGVGLNKPSVLVDLSFAHKDRGFAGIPQETRILFNTLCQSSSLDVTGWLNSLKGVFTSKKLDHLITQVQFLAFGLSDESFGLVNPYLQFLFKKSPRFIKQFLFVKSLIKKSYRISPLQSTIDFSQIWRNFFHMKIPFSEWEHLNRTKYVLSDLSVQRRGFKLWPAKITTKGYRFVLFQDAHFVKFPQGTIPLVRYHDAVPLLAADTVLGSWSPANHLKKVRSCENKAIFICSSDSSYADLAKVSPLASEKARIIPCVVPKMERKNVSANQFQMIAKNYLSSSTRGSLEGEEVLQRWFGKQMNRIPKFIMTLSTIEPRKNHLGLINAWQKLKFICEEDVQLLVVGSPGWGCESILSTMQSLVKSGHLLHLEKVPQDLIPYLYSAALAFVFPSFKEGFGLPVCEAMQCGCPVAVSDIMAHRFIAKDAALYFSPYDTDAMAAALLQLIQLENLKENLVAKGHLQAARFDQKAILPQWEALFDELNRDF